MKRQGLRLTGYASVQTDGEGREQFPLQTHGVDSMSRLQKECFEQNTISVIVYPGW